MADEAADGRAPAVQGRAPESDAPADTASPMAPDSSAADDLASLTQRTEERFRRTEESFRRLENMTEGLTRTVGSFMAVISASPVANRLSGEQEAAELAALPTVPILRQRVDGDGPGADSARRDLRRDLESAARGPRPDSTTPTPTPSTVARLRLVASSLSYPIRPLRPTCLERQLRQACCRDRRARK